jgi:protein subunit release factor B
MVIINSTQENQRIIKMITIKIKPSNQGVETEDTAKILANMYLQWTKNKNVFISESYNDKEYKIITSIRDINILSNEIGVHRIVRVSPFDEKSRRHTSFVLVSLNNEEYDTRSKVRNYVFDPYTLVRNFRDERETEDIYSFINGDIESLMKDI